MLDELEARYGLPSDRLMEAFLDEDGNLIESAEWRGGTAPGPPGRSSADSRRMLPAHVRGPGSAVFWILGWFDRLGGTWTPADPVEVFRDATGMISRIRVEAHHRLRGRGQTGR